MRLGTRLEDERESVGIRADGEAAHFGKDQECRDRCIEEGVCSNDVVVAEG